MLSSLHNLLIFSRVRLLGPGNAEPAAGDSDEDTGSDDIGAKQREIDYPRVSGQQQMILGSGEARMQQDAQQDTLGSVVERAVEVGRPLSPDLSAAYEVRRVVTMTMATKSNSTIDTGAQRARSAVLLVMMLRTTATAA